MSTTYYPVMAYRMVSLEPALRPPTALGELTKTTWCSPGNRYGACEPVRGVAVPMLGVALSAFIDLQRQINRLLVKMGRVPVAVDGRPGSNTAKALGTVLVWARTHGLAGGAAVTSMANNAGRAIPIDLIAQYADDLGVALRRVADAQAAAPVADPPQSRPSQPTANGGVVNPPADVIVASAGGGGISAFFAGLGVPTPLGIAAAAVAALALYKATKGGVPGRRARRRR